MQKCLQKKRASKRIIGAAVVAFAVFSAVLTMTDFNESVPNSATFSAKYGKYLDVSDNGFDVSWQNSFDNVKEENAEMNNSGVQNSKSDTSAVNHTPKPSADTVGYPLNINVYMHETGKYEIMPFEEYVLGCVLAEMPSEFEAQALMAQAVAVRSFTCSKIHFDGLSSHPDSPVCTDYRHCQSYISPESYIKKGDYAVKAVEKIRQAVDATHGICAVFDGVPITAVYHASSGVRTKSSSEVWGGEVPYLVSVKAPEDRNLCSVGYTYSYRDAEKKLSRPDEAVKCFSSDGRQIECINDSDGLVSAMSFSGKVFGKDEIQEIFSLRSSDFSANLTDDGITFTSYGYGHGVGMSQHGANALAKDGLGFMDILKYYYNGISFSYIY